MNKKILYIELDNVLVDFQAFYPKSTYEIVKEDKVDHLEDVSVESAWQKPLTGAIEAYKKLSQKYDTYIMSSASWKSPSVWGDKVKWVQKYLGNAAYKRVILSHCQHLNRGSYIIDCGTFYDVEAFKGTHIHLWSDQFPDWDSVVRYLTSPEADTIAEIQKKYPNAYMPWYEEDDENLELLLHQGKTIEEIAAIFKRQTGGIKSRVVKLWTEGKIRFNNLE